MLAHSRNKAFSTKRSQGIKSWVHRDPLSLHYENELPEWVVWIVLVGQLKLCSKWNIAVREIQALLLKIVSFGHLCTWQARRCLILGKLFELSCKWLQSYCTIISFLMWLLLFPFSFKSNIFIKWTFYQDLPKTLSDIELVNFFSTSSW